MGMNYLLNKFKSGGLLSASKNAAASRSGVAAACGIASPANANAARKHRPAPGRHYRPGVRGQPVA